MEMIKLKLGPAWLRDCTEWWTDTPCFHFFRMCDKFEAGTGGCLD